MKTYLARLLLACATAIIAVAPSALAQCELTRDKGRASKFYAFEHKRDIKIQRRDKICATRHPTAFNVIGQKTGQDLDAPSTEIAASGVAKADSTKSQNSATTGAAASEEIGANPAVFAQLVLVGPEKLQRI